LTLLHASRTDIGCKRSRNEDAVGFFTSDLHPGVFLLIVADGVGGSVAGDVASQLAVDTIARTVFQRLGAEDASAILSAAFKVANGAILAEGVRRPDRAGMATTCTAALLRGPAVVIGHVGDCRAYLLGDGRLVQLTRDHSLADRYCQTGDPAPEMPGVLANVLTRWLGAEGVLDVDIATEHLAADGALVLCSDGLNKVVRDAEILEAILGLNAGSACRHLIDLARKRGGPDNITVQVAQMRAG
jgi:serine/threonine protein phosphatase PrpC